MENPEECKTLEPKDSASFKHIKYFFYKGNDGCLYEKKFIIDKFDSNYCKMAYYDKYINPMDSLPTPLDSIIDINSFVQIDSTGYSKDNKNVYYYQDNTDGGMRYITVANSSSFVKLHDYRWGRDNKHIFHKGVAVIGLDANSCILMPEHDSDGNESFVDYVKDTRHVFYDCDSVMGADPETFKVVNDRLWDAQDKNHKYQYGKRLD
ncbi:MAG TPA: DKNYY domain-containing protein [Nitrosopumilaceae archaeon]|nr:DKNYY domain-containing protein [Nitrosopumilaceae archaeon]